jgi:hypothetical protein
MPTRLLPAPPVADAPAAPPRGGRQARGAAAPAPVPAADATTRLAAALGARPAGPPPAGPPPAGPPPAGRHPAAYGAAAYRAADALRARPRDEAVELSVRHTADGGRLTVARRTADARTVAIEAQIA